MQIYADKLAANLQGTLAPVYLVAGDEPLLRDDALAQIREAARANGFDSNEKLLQDNSFNWQQLADALGNLSLFAERRLVELKLSTSKIGTEGSQAVVNCLELLDSDTLLVIQAPRIEGKPKWLNAIIDTGVYVPVYPLDTQQLPRWLAGRARSKGLKLERAAAEQLAERVEGNLVTAVQELEKLALLCGSGNVIDAELVDTSVVDNARFSTFNMLDRAIDGDSRAASKALRKLREEGSEAVAIIAAMAYQLRTLQSLQQFASAGKLAQGFKSNRVLARRQQAIGQLLQRLSTNDLNQCVIALADADSYYKSGRAEISWMLVENILLVLAGQRLAVASLIHSPASA